MPQDRVREDASFLDESAAFAAMAQAVAKIVISSLACHPKSNGAPYFPMRGLVGESWPPTHLSRPL